MLIVISQLVRTVKFVLFATFVTGVANAGITKAKRVTAHQLMSSTEVYFTARNISRSTSAINSDNRIFQIPNSDANVDIRPEVKWLYGRSAKVIFRPRWLLNYQNIKYTNPDENRTISTGLVQLTDFYLENIWSGSFRSTVGLQVYQWGSAELMNPSNPLFHFDSSQKNSSFKEKGQVLLRGNLDYSRNWSQVLIVEPIPNNETPWQASGASDSSSEPFSAKGLLRTEWSSLSGANSFGFVIGREDQQVNFIGETLNFSPADGLSVYVDAKQAERSYAFYPQANIYGGDTLNRAPSNSVTQLAILGMRSEWSFVDVRFELVDNQAGWDKSQFNRVVQSLKTLNPDLALNYSRFSRPGLELMSKRYYYFSLRFPNLGKKQNRNLSFRYLLSDLDGSGVLRCGGDWNFSDSLTVFLETTTPFGAVETDLNFTGQSNYLLGLKWNI